MGTDFSLSDRLLDADTPAYRITGALYEHGAPMNETDLFTMADVDTATYETVRDELDGVVRRSDYGTGPNAQNPDREPEYWIERMDRFASSPDRLDALETVINNKNPYTWSALDMIRTHADYQGSRYTVDGVDGVPATVIGQQLDVGAPDEYREYVDPLLDAGLVTGTHYTADTSDDGDPEETGFLSSFWDWVLPVGTESLALEDVDGPFFVPRDDDIYMDLFDTVVYVSSPRSNEEEIPATYCTARPYYYF